MLEMKILWMTWKDLKNPYAGGAEVVNEQLAKRLARDGHEVIFLVRGFGGAPREERVDGYTIIRVGNFHTVYWQAFLYYRKHLQGWADLVIEEVNTIPFFCNFYVREKSILFFHQLCREIWFYEMGLVKGFVGYIAETMYLLLLGNRNVITVSQSSRKDLLKFGFKRNKVQIISEGIEIRPLEKLGHQEDVKYAVPTMLSFGSLRPMKRTDQIIQAFELAKKEIPDLRLVIAGDPAGNSRVLEMIRTSLYSASIQFLGKVSREKKMELMQKAHVIAVASVKEGWGLVVTEANSQGTPAVVYNIDGLRDSVRHEETGIVALRNTPEGLSQGVISLLKDPGKYAKIRHTAWQWSQKFDFETSYQAFLELLKK